MNINLLFVFLCIFITGCATPYEVAVVQTGDVHMNCQDIKGSIQEANTFLTLADHEQGMTGTNVTSALLWWPGLVATYINTTDAKEAAQERTKHLARLYEDKGCRQLQNGGSMTPSVRLKKLDEVYNKKLITEDEYRIQRQNIIDSM